MRLFGQADSAGHFKDAFHEFVVNGIGAAINPARRGTKVASHHRVTIVAGGQAVIRMRLSADGHAAPFDHFDHLVGQRMREAVEARDFVTARDQDRA